MLGKNTYKDNETELCPCWFNYMMLSRERHKIKVSKKVQDTCPTKGTNISGALTRCTLRMFHWLPVYSESRAQRTLEPEMSQYTPRIQLSSFHMKMHIHKESTLEKFPLGKNVVLKLHPAADLWHAAGPCSNISPCYSHTCHNAQFLCCFTHFSSSHCFFKYIFHKRIKPPQAPFQ